MCISFSVSKWAPYIRFSRDGVSLLSRKFGNSWFRWKNKNTQVMLVLIFTCTFSELFISIKIWGFPPVKLVTVLLPPSPVMCLPWLSCGPSVLHVFELSTPVHFSVWDCRELVSAPGPSVHLSVSTFFSWLSVWFWLNILPVYSGVLLLFPDANGRVKGLCFLWKWRIWELVVC